VQTCVQVGIDDHRELLHINTCRDGDTGISNLMTVDSRIHYRTLAIALLNKMACLITCYCFAGNRNITY